MQWLSTRGDCLRAVGHLLDSMGAENVTLEEGDTQLLVRYSKAGTESELRYATTELQELLDAARARRDEAVSSLPTSYEQKLRAIGREIDRNGGKELRVRQIGGSFEVRYFTYREGHTRAFYTPEKLASLAQHGPTRRSPQTTHPSA